VCLPRKQRTTSCEGARLACPCLDPTLYFLPRPNPPSAQRQLLLRHTRCPCITFVVAAQHILLTLNASLSAAVET
jgi:hypothetical protein